MVVYQEQSEEETEWQGLEEIGWGRKARSSRGSGLQSVPLIQRFSGPLMGLVRENHQGERPGCALPISEWGWAGLLGWTEGSLPHPPLRPVPCQ